MSNYVKATNFATKDTLPSGDSNKIVKGTEIDNEFNAIAGAVSSKADIASPTFTGVPAAPTATAGSNTTQIVNTAYVKNELTALGLGNMSTQNKTAVDITGGTINGVTITSLAAALAVADGGTGRSTLDANAVLVGNGTSGINSIAPGTSGNVLKSNGTAWASATLKGIGIGGEVWNNVTGSRALGTTYTNSRGYPIMISVRGNAATYSHTYIYVNGTLTYWHGAQWNGAGAYPGGALIIPNGATYSVTFDAGYGLAAWYELY
jgi:hypothetical protein